MASGAEPTAPATGAPVDRLEVVDPAGALRAEGRFAEAAALLDAEIERCELDGRTYRLARAKLARGVVAHDLGDLAGAAQLLTEARRTLVAGQRAEAVAVCAFDLAVVHHDLGELDDSVDRLQEARAIFESIGHLVDAAACNQNLGVVLHGMGRDAEARGRLEAARAAFTAAGRTEDVTECERDLAIIGPAARDTASSTRPWADGMALSPG